MYAKATKNVLRDIDPEGDLIPVSNLNDSDKLHLLCLVTKRKRFWCWQNPKYHFLSFTLDDILTKGKPLKPVVIESDFVKYEGKFGDFLEANLETEIGAVKLNAARKGFVESRNSFGNLRKQEVDMQQLMKNAQERTINMKHPLVQQMLGRRNETLCILKEKIITTQKCVLLEHIQKEGKQGGVAGMKTPVVKVSVSENGNLIQDANVVLEIPPPAAIAYAVIELYIKHDGHFEFCLLSEKEGGFERNHAEGHCQGLGASGIFSMYQWDIVDSGDTKMMNRAAVPSDASLSVLKQDILQQTKIFQSFLELPEEKRSVLHRLLCKILCHGETVTLLENLLGDMCTGQKPHLTALNELKWEQQQNIQDLWKLLGYTVENDLVLQLEEHQQKKLLLATHCLISAVEELDDSALAVLETYCDLHLIPALSCLLNTVLEESTSLGDPPLSIFKGKEEFQMLQQLFTLSNIKLERTENYVKAVTTREPGFLPLLLLITVFGFHALAG
ncbi:gasdermin-E [Microcaecilia unicolor]|uniref:Gasdermin-E n=1 Tax=Microcaecilia unicolor TaxID=1415580 RepID=A0A6P7XYB0_9AMPH|nr:gasdermin-E [Microcaecilia unicolor]XP_030057926.1 gasdermin-E [Microcaecilia unicolor]XP_030057935.1 gasdermin-E [Microcaecilia unicolor]XP_030057944.1 gasdermin-E [Microcaecilia unicolor]XP_030057950.1 gasdermin-E [Microcaecilia unicolor]XP_030057960.1 gasdermin-E [Microcaecilia unicolor]